MGIDEIRRILESLGARYALIGAHAMAARGYPRSTVDVDFLTADHRVLDPAVWTEITRSGGTVESRRGDHDDHGDLLSERAAGAPLRSSIERRLTTRRR